MGLKKSDVKKEEEVKLVTPGNPVQKQKFEDFKKILPAVLRAASLSLTHNELACVAGVHPKTFREWLKNNPQLRAAIALKKLEADNEIESKLRRRANGFTYREVSREVGVNGRGEMIDKTTTTVKHALPDVKAINIWLQNRKPKHWKANREASEGGGGVKVIKDDII